jgi:hypothetical protein
MAHQALMRAPCHETEARYFSHFLLRAGVRVGIFRPSRQSTSSAIPIVSMDIVDTLTQSPWTHGGRQRPIHPAKRP